MNLFQGWNSLEEQDKWNLQNNNLSQSLHFHAHWHYQKQDPIKNQSKQTLSTYMYIMAL